MKLLWSSLEAVDAHNIILRRAAMQNRAQERETFLVISMNIREAYVAQLQRVIEENNGLPWELTVRDNDARWQESRLSAHACVHAGRRAAAPPQGL